MATISSRLTLEMTVGTFREEAKMEMRMFTSSIPVKATKASCPRMPSSSNSSCWVPLPWMTVAFGSASHNSRQRSSFSSMILTVFPMSVSNFAR